MREHYLLFLFLLLFGGAQLPGQAARQAENWHFGQGISVSFLNGVPVLNPPSSMDALEGCVSMSDTSGNLLFYTNGGGETRAGGRNGRIWNRNHQIIFDLADRAGGGISARQSSIAFADPAGREGIYYLFTMEDDPNATGPRMRRNGLRYFVFDMNRNDGQGEITVADLPVFEGSTEALDVVRGSTPDEVYVVCNDRLSTPARLVLVPVNATGVGSPILFPMPDGEATQHFQFSPDGTYVFFNDRLYNFTPGNPLGEPVRVFPDNISNGPGFTADSKYLYVNEGTSISDVSLARYDLSNFERLELLRYDPEEEGIVTSLGGFQLGPNGNLYYTEQTNYMGDGDDIFGLNEIACPSTLSPQLNREIVSFEGFETTGGNITLPQYLDAIFLGTDQSDTVFTSILQETVCLTGDIELIPRVEGESYLWSDGSSAPTLLITTAGSYCATITDGCQVTVDCRTVVDASLNLDGLSIAVSPAESDGELCAGRSAVLSITGEAADLLSSITWTRNDETTDTDSLSLRLDPDDDIVAVVTDSCGNERMLDFMVSIPPCTCEDPAFPEIISANNDGTNDRFGAFSECMLETFSLTIFNRWGQQVFSTTEPDEYWDGSINGKPQNIGTYLFLSTFTVEGSQETREVEGQFMLVR